MSFKLIMGFVVEALDGRVLNGAVIPYRRAVEATSRGPLEGIMPEIRRRTRMVGAFSDGNLALNRPPQVEAHRRHSLVQ